VKGQVLKSLYSLSSLTSTEGLFTEQIKKKSRKPISISYIDSIYSQGGGAGRQKESLNQNIGGVDEKDSCSP